MILKKLAAAGALLALGANANAVPVTFDLSGGPNSSVNVVDFDPSWLCIDCGISATLNPLLDTLDDTLSVGESWTFNFFTLSYYGIGGGDGTIEASLAFDSPVGAPNADASGEGGFFTLFGVLTGGDLTWQTIDPFTLDDGTRYSVSFENLEGVDVLSTTVHGTITLLQEGAPVSVPEPGMLGLVGLTLLGAGAAARRRKKAQI